MKDDIDYVNKFIKENDGFFDTGTIYTTIRNNFDKKQRDRPTFLRTAPFTMC